MSTLKYADETDRAYGLSGMSVCLCVLEKEQYINAISLDSSPDHGMEFTPDFFQTINQRLSAKAVWNGNFNHFKLLTGLVVSNLMCRTMVKEHRELTRELSDLLLSDLRKEGKEACSLDDDETRNVYYESYNVMHRVFAHPQVNSIIERFVEQLSAKRRLERDEIMMLLRPLIG